jgi:O-antigen/teichoic acid export membrane protein
MCLPGIAGFKNAAVTWMSSHLVGVLALTFYALLSFYTGLMSGSLRAAHRFALSVHLNTAMRTIEMAVTLLTVALSSNLESLCLALLCARTICLLVLIVVVRKIMPWLSFRPRFDQVTNNRKILVSGVAFMAFPLGHALLNQGVLIAIGLRLDTAAVASLAVMRSLTRLVSQLMNVVIQAFEPEVTIAYAKMDWTTIRRICRHAFRLSFWIGAVACIGIVILGPWFLAFWTRGLAAIDNPSLWLLCIAQFITTLWLASSIAISGTSQHHATSAVFLLIAISTVLLSIPAVEHGGLRLVCFVLVFMECAMACFVIRRSCKLTGENLLSYLRSPFVKNLH